MASALLAMSPTFVWSQIDDFTHESDVSTLYGAKSLSHNGRLIPTISPDESKL